MSSSGTTAATRRKRSWAQPTSSLRATALPRVISRAGRAAPSRSSDNSDSPSGRYGDRPSSLIGQLAPLNETEPVHHSAGEDVIACGLAAPADLCADTTVLMVCGVTIALL